MWADIADGRMPPLPVMEHFDIFEDAGSGFVNCPVVLRIDQLHLQSAEEGLHRGGSSEEPDGAASVGVRQAKGSEQARS